MGEWQPIETLPDENIAVVLLYSGRVWHNSNGEKTTEIESPHRTIAEKCEIAFVHDYGYGLGFELHDTGTGHRTAEQWEMLGNPKPTHWMPLPSPPTSKPEGE